MKKILIGLMFLSGAIFAVELKECVENKLTNLVSILSCTHGEYKVTYAFSNSTTNGIPDRDDKKEPKVEILYTPSKQP